MKKLKKTKIFIFGKKSHNAEKNLKGGDPLGFFNIHSVAKHQKKCKGDPLGKTFSFGHLGPYGVAIVLRSEHSKIIEIEKLFLLLLHLINFNLKQITASTVISNCRYVETSSVV